MYRALIVSAGLFFLASPVLAVAKSSWMIFIIVGLCAFPIYRWSFWTLWLCLRTPLPPKPVGWDKTVRGAVRELHGELVKPPRRAAEAEATLK